MVSLGFYMHHIGRGDTVTFHRASATSYTESIPWRVLRNEAERAFVWLSQQGPLAWIRPGSDEKSLLVAVLFMPGTGGGSLYYSTICRGEKADQMMNFNYANRYAPAWLKANNDRPNRTHCEDGVCFDFEVHNNRLPDGDPDKIRIINNRYVPLDRDGRALNPQIAVYGVKNLRYFPNPALQDPCSKHTQSRNTPKVPPCQDVLAQLRVRFCTLAKIREEEEEEARRAQAARNARPGGGSGAGGAGQGYGAGGGGGHGGGYGGGGYSGGGPSGGTTGGGGPSGGTTGGGSDPAADLPGMMTNMKIGSKVDWKQNSKGDWYYKDRNGDWVYEDPKPKKSSNTEPKKSSSSTEWKKDSRGDWYYKDRNGDRVYEDPKPKKSSNTEPKKSSSSTEWKKDSRGDWYYKDRNGDRVYQRAR
ncbi:hypothetical protein B0I37DRAFT_302127 [Chaetomium sp. MPI-CAGE-AT-0009]|nr:hypothetical protein B0I37DRAFT_302127 [Chaetomium sp. MPI-CAGE-AT-0009]